MAQAPASTPQTTSDAPLALARQRTSGLLGLLVLGGYTLGHLVGLVPMAAGGVEAFNATLGWRRSTVLLVAVALLCGLPLIFHTLHGLRRLATLRVTVGRFPAWGNWVHASRQLAGLVVLVFLAVHVFEMRVWPAVRGAQVDGAYLQRYFSSFLTVDFYVLGILATVFHLWAGVWTLLFRWGVTVGPVAQRRAAWAALGGGGLMALLALWVLAAFHDGRFVVP